MSTGKNTCGVLVIILSIGVSDVGDASAATVRGQTLSERWCSQCHAVKPNQASANPAAPKFADLAAESSITEYSLRAFLRTPHETMPNITLKPDDMDDIVSYILSLKSRR
jgi:mono/diheme cytochrome c family protein